MTDIFTEILNTVLNTTGAAVEWVIAFIGGNPLIGLLILVILWGIIELLDRFFPTEKLKDKFEKKLNKKPEVREEEKGDWD